MSDRLATRASPTALTEWRRARLRRAGFDAALATQLAADDAFDLHALLELCDRGCPPHLAARILAPLEPEAGGR
jgi:hypothetical protein